MENLAHSLYIFQFLYSNKSANYQKKSIKLKLWQFLIVCLNNDHMKNTILWGRELGHFMILNGDELAKQWGNHKQNSKMDYTKLCRALRNYQNEEIITKLERNRKSYIFNFSTIYTKLNISEPNLLDLYHIMQKRSSSELFLNFIQVLKYDRTRTIYAIP
uniref:Transcriptional regulator Erg (Trinotate prediction) n=1 Tax=Henneguya salminicola TaxID=69463 RepID=A0A6G3MH67_HENSL